MPITLPDTFGRYKILNKLGEGGMGAVYLAEDTRLGRRVALKVPHFNDNQNTTILDRFYREARMAARIEHSNLCPIYDVDCVDGIHYITMAFVDGTPLAKLVGEGKPWLPGHALDLVRNMALALQVLHEAGIVHRDLKPGNVMIRTKDNVPIIMDFGLARSFQQQSQQLTGNQSPLGTPAYMSPEQVMGDANAIGPRSDIWALGAILYEMITGRLPFTGGLVQVFAAILHTNPAAPSQLVPNLPPQIDMLVMQALAKDPADRPESMQAFAKTLADALSQSKSGNNNDAQLNDTLTPNDDPGLPSVEPCGAPILGSDTNSALPGPVWPSPPVVGQTHRNRLRAGMILISLAGVVASAIWLTLLLFQTSVHNNEFTNSIGMKLVHIPQGTFMMGSEPDERDGQEGEDPQHQVELTKSFYMGAYEVTQNEYNEVMGVNPSAFQKGGKEQDTLAGIKDNNTDRFPVESVSWAEAKRFCDKLSESPNEILAGRKYRLPTEAEWEYACRANPKTYATFHFGPGLHGDQANFYSWKPFKSGSGKAGMGRPVGVDDPKYEPNAFGLYHMHGNVWEWCQDWHRKDYYTTCSKMQPFTDPQGPEETQNARIIRGGSWKQPGQACRTAYRGYIDPKDKTEEVGFRVVCEVGPPECGLSVWFAAFTLVASMIALVLTFLLWHKMSPRVSGAT